MNNPPDMLRVISSGLTLYTKIVTPVTAVVLFATFGRMFVSDLRADSAGQISLFGVFFLGIVGYHLWNSIRVKRVKADSRNLYISNYFKETTVPLDQIADVTEIRFLEPRIVTIHLKSESEFGQKIAFLAPWRFFGWYSPHPVVDELRQMAGQSTYKEVSDRWFS